MNFNLGWGPESQGRFPVSQPFMFMATAKESFAVSEWHGYDKVIDEYTLTANTKYNVA